MSSHGGTYVKPRRRWWLIGLGVLVGLAGIAAAGLVIAYPRVGASMVKRKAVDKLSAKLGRQVAVGSVDVAFGHAVLHDIDIRGELDGDTPLVHVDRVDVDFDGWASLRGKVVLGAAIVEGVDVSLRREADGRDNVRDVLARVRDHTGSANGDGDSDDAAALRPTSIAVHHVRVLANDELTGATALVSDADARWVPGDLVAQAHGVSATTINAPKAAAALVEIRKHEGSPPVVRVDGGEVALWPKLSLSGMAGSIVADPEHAGHYAVDLAGGYGGVPGRLWTAKGTLDPVALTASLDLDAAKFQLDRLAPILEHSAAVDYKDTSIDTAFHVDVDRAGAKFSGEFHLRGLNVGHPMLADKEVHDLDLSGKIAGSYDRGKRELELQRGDFVTRDVPFSVTGVLAAPKRSTAEGSTAAPAIAATTPAMTVATDAQVTPPPAPVPTSGPHGLQIVQLHLVIPTVDCQRVLDAIPKEMAPYMSGYRMRGTFDADVLLGIDYADLDATTLDGHVGIRNCKVVDEPGDSPARLKTEFEHYVEVDKGEWMSFVVGPTNPDFVPFDQISPYLVKSIMSTEDSGFYYHHGFITTEFKTALVNDLKAGGFKFGASSITMQMVKNVLLYREKTLARKLQELFLTWDVENTLTKDRILEIYFNVIEFGPGLYGIGPAAQHYFGKPAKDLNPVEAAFFSTILPAPKQRYQQYCQGTLSKWTQAKIERILAIELKRDRLTQAEYDEAMATPLLFAKPDGAESEDDCMKRTRQAIKNARSTSPFAAGASDDGPIAPVAQAAQAAQAAKASAPTPAPTPTSDPKPATDPPKPPAPKHHHHKKPAQPAAP